MFGATGMILSSSSRMVVGDRMLVMDMSMKLELKVTNPAIGYPVTGASLRGSVMTSRISRLGIDWASINPALTFSPTPRDRAFCENAIGQHHAIGTGQISIDSGCAGTYGNCGNCDGLCAPCGMAKCVSLDAGGFPPLYAQKWRISSSSPKLTISLMSGKAGAISAICTLGDILVQGGVALAIYAGSIIAPTTTGNCALATEGIRELSFTVASNADYTGWYLLCDSQLSCELSILDPHKNGLTAPKYTGLWCINSGGAAAGEVFSYKGGWPSYTIHGNPPLNVSDQSKIYGCSILPEAALGVIDPNNGCGVTASVLTGVGPGLFPVAPTFIDAQTVRISAEGVYSGASTVTIFANITYQDNSVLALTQVRMTVVENGCGHGTLSLINISGLALQSTPWEQSIPTMVTVSPGGCQFRVWTPNSTFEVQCQISLVYPNTTITMTSSGMAPQEFGLNNTCVSVCIGSSSCNNQTIGNHSDNHSSEYNTVSLAGFTGIFGGLGLLLSSVGSTSAIINLINAIIIIVISLVGIITIVYIAKAGIKLLRSDEKGANPRDVATLEKTQFEVFCTALQNIANDKDCGTGLAAPLACASYSQASRFGPLVSENASSIPGEAKWTAF